MAIALLIISVLILTLNNFSVIRDFLARGIQKWQKPQ